MKNPTKIQLVLIAIIGMLFTSWTLPKVNINTWKISLSNKTIISYDKNIAGDMVEVKRSLLTSDAIIAVNMYFSGSETEQAECMVIISNQDGKTISGTSTQKNKTDFSASISVKELLANPEFKSADRLNIMFDIKKAKTEGLNQVYILGVFKLV